METTTTNTADGQVIKFNQEELDKFKVLERKYQESIFQFGQLYLEQLSIEDQSKNLKIAQEKLTTDHLDIQKEERDFLTTLANKYGEGSLSLADGTFIPTKK
jgi:hypothetical protein